MSNNNGEAQPPERSQKQTSAGDMLRAFEKEPNFVDYPIVAILFAIQMLIFCSAQALGGSLFPSEQFPEIAELHPSLMEAAPAVAPYQEWAKGVSELIYDHQILSTILFVLAGYMPLGFILFSRMILRSDPTLRQTMSFIAIAGVLALMLQGYGQTIMIRPPPDQMLLAAAAIFKGGLLLMLLSNPSTKRRTFVIACFGAIFAAFIAIDAFTGNAEQLSAAKLALEAAGQSELPALWATLYAPPSDAYIVILATSEYFTLALVLFAIFAWRPLINQGRLLIALALWTPAVIGFAILIAANGYAAVTGPETVSALLGAMLIGMIITEILSGPNGIAASFISWNRRQADAADDRAASDGV